MIPRFKILKMLRTTGPAFVDEIAKETGIHARMVSHHVDVLEEQKLVESKYELAKVGGSKRGVAVRTCWTTDKAEETPAFSSAPPQTAALLQPAPASQAWKYLVAAGALLLAALVLAWLYLRSIRYVPRPSIISQSLDKEGK